MRLVFNLSWHSARRVGTGMRSMRGDIEHEERAHAVVSHDVFRKSAEAQCRPLSRALGNSSIVEPSQSEMFIQAY